MRGYLFISNGTKPTEEQYTSLAPFAIGSFSFAAMSAARDLGYRLYYGLNRKYADKVSCTNFDVTFYDQHLYRNIFGLRDNYKAYKNCCHFLETHPDIEVIHCNTPIGGVVGRLCGWKFRKKVIYTAHGFHFYKGAPLKNWLLFYPIEKMLARLTDVIITINKEDYELASKQFHLRNGGKVYYVPGVGIDLKQYDDTRQCRTEKRQELGLTDNDVALFSMGDLVARKNYPPAIRAVAETGNKHMHYFICGDGPERENLERLAVKHNVQKQIHFLGYRIDVKELLQAVDIFLFTTLLEGPSRSLMEAMSSGLPCVVSDVKGNTDLIIDGQNGFLCSSNDHMAFAEKILLLTENVSLRERLGKQARLSIQALNINSIKDETQEVFSDIFQIKMRGYLGIVVGDLNENKNVGVLIRSLPHVHANVHFLICGQGPCEISLRKLAKELSMEDRVHFLGYRSDVGELYKVSDFFLMASKREGLPRSTMEAMASGLPCVVSKIRGNTDLIDANKGGFLICPEDSEGYANAINNLIDNPMLCRNFGSYNLDKIKSFDCETVESSLLSVYTSLLKI